MISVLEYRDGAVGKGDLTSSRDAKVFTWIDALEASKNELAEIAEAVALTPAEFAITIDEEERAKVIELDGPFSLIIFGAPSFEKDETITAPLFIYVSKRDNCVITVRAKDFRAVNKIKENLETRKSIFERGSSYFVYRLLMSMLSTYFIVIDDIEKRIDRIEDHVVKTPSIDIVERIFETKKTLIYFAKTLVANREAVASIQRGYLSGIDKRTAKKFATVYNDIVQLVDTSTTYRDLLTGTLDTYLSSVSLSLNQVMKTLTVGATFVLVPTLIASIYGMNFMWMPELQWKYGYFFALGLMVTSVLLIYIFFKRKKWI